MTSPCYPAGLRRNELVRKSILIAIVVVLGLFTKVYKGPFAEFVRGNAGGSFYVVFFMLAISILCPCLKFCLSLILGWAASALAAIAPEKTWITPKRLISPTPIPSCNDAQGPFPLAVIVVVSTCCIEFLQLWKLPILEAARATRLGQLLLGSTFSWRDFPPYLIGGIAGYFILRWISRNSWTKSQTE